MPFTVFTRTWWRANPAWPDGRQPGVGPSTTIAQVATEAEAQQICRDWNATHDPGFLSLKAEYRQEGQ